MSSITSTSTDFTVTWTSKLRTRARRRPSYLLLPPAPARDELNGLTHHAKPTKSMPAFAPKTPPMRDLSLSAELQSN